MNAQAARLFTPELILPEQKKRAAILTASQLGKHFKHRQRRREIFADIDLSVNSGEIVCLLGASGCGKSTLLMTLAGLQPLQNGSIAFKGRPLTAPHPKIALVFQEPCLLPWLSVADNAAFGLRLGKNKPSRHEMQQAVSTVLNAVGLNDVAHAYPEQLSGGMAQRVSLARALALKPDILLLDEPFSALDAITRLEMQRLLLREIREYHCAALLVTHDIDEALLLADRILLMGGSPGRLIREWALTDPFERRLQQKTLIDLRLDILKTLSECCADSLTPAGALS